MRESVFPLSGRKKVSDVEGDAQKPTAKPLGNHVPGTFMRNRQCTVTKKKTGTRAFPKKKNNELQILLRPGRGSWKPKAKSRTIEAHAEISGIHKVPRPRHGRSSSKTALGEGQSGWSSHKREKQEGLEKRT